MPAVVRSLMLASAFRLYTAVKTACPGAPLDTAGTQRQGQQHAKLPLATHQPHDPAVTAHVLPVVGAGGTGAPALLHPPPLQQQQ